MTTGAIFQVTFLWQIKATNGVDSNNTHGTQLCRSLGKEVTGDTPEQALTKFRDWYCQKRNEAVLEYQKEEKASNTFPGISEEKFKTFWPMHIQITSITQKGTIII